MINKNNDGLAKCKCKIIHHNMKYNLEQLTTQLQKNAWEKIVFRAGTQPIFYIFLINISSNQMG